MTDEILGRNPLEAWDSIWKIPKGDSAESKSLEKELEEDLDFPDPLKALANNLEHAAFDANEGTETEASPEAAFQQPSPPAEESPDYFEIPDYAEESLSEAEQNALHGELPETESFSEDFTNSICVAETEPAEVHAEPEGSQNQGSEFLKDLSVKELAPILSEGCDIASLNFEPDFAEKLASEIRRTFPQGIQGSAKTTPSETTAPTPIPKPEPVQTLPAVIEDNFDIPDISVDEKTVERNLANMVTLDDLVFEKPPTPRPEPSQPISNAGAFPIESPESNVGFDVKAYLLGTDLPVPVQTSKPVPKATFESSQEMATNKEDADERKNRAFASIVQMVGFTLDEEFYGIDIMLIQEIIRLQDVTPVPRSANFILGVLNLRGKVIPIIDLRRRFSLPKAKATNHTRIIIVNVDVGTIGFVVDQVSEVIRLPKSAIETAPATSTNINAEYIKGVGHMGENGNELLIILDLNKVLTKEKKEILEEVA